MRTAAQLAIAVMLALVPGMAGAQGQSIPLERGLVDEEDTQVVSRPVRVPGPNLVVVAVMPETGQALVWDGSGEQYRLLLVGDHVRGWRVARVRPYGMTLARGAVRLPLNVTPPPSPIWFSQPVESGLVDEADDGGYGDLR